MNAVEMTVSSGQMQCSIVAHVRGIHSSTLVQQHLDDVEVALFGGPVKWRKSMVISEISQLLIDAKPSP